MEVLSSKLLPGSLELISCLLETLNKVVHSSTAAADRSYVEQLLMTAVESAVVNVQARSIIPQSAYSDRFCRRALLSCREQSGWKY